MLLAVQSVFLSLSLSFPLLYAFVSSTHHYLWLACSTERLFTVSVTLMFCLEFEPRHETERKKNPLKLLCNQMLWWSEHNACAIVFLPAHFTDAGYKFPGGKNNEHRQCCLETRPGVTFVRLQQQDNPATINIAAKSDSWGQAPREQHEIHKQDVLMSFHFSET